MTKEKKIVFVSASFDEPANLFSWLKRYGRSADEKFVYLDEFAFTPFPCDESDAILVFNTPRQPILMKCYPEQTMAFMMEPGHPAEHPWMYKGLSQYARVYSHLPHSTNTILSHGYLGWYLQKDLLYLETMLPPEKTRNISCIASGLKQLEGHRLRLGFVNMLKKELPSIDFFGKGFHFLPDKMDGLLQYKYSIAIENASLPFYFTEKINDCFLAWTVPIYFGCSNIGKFFPAKSFISIDVRDPKNAIKKIRDIPENDDWQERQHALIEARQLVLHKYQPLAGAAEILQGIRPTSKTTVSLEPVNQTWNDKLVSTINKLLKNDGS